ncbi:hypothetical protein, partial [Klebsiella pneumoniae]
YSLKQTRYGDNKNHAANWTYTSQMLKNAPKRFWGVFPLTGVIASPPSTNTLTDDVMRQNLSFSLLSQNIVSGNVNRTGCLAE